MFWELERWGDRPALWLDGGERALTYAQLARLCDQVPSGPRELRLLQADNDLESLVQYLAALRGGHPVWLCASNLAPELLEEMKAHYRPGPGEFHPDLAVLLSTSGTTGSLKLVRLSRGNVQSNAEQIAEYLELDEQERPITSLPLSYSYGFSVVNSHLQVGASLALTQDSVVSKPFWETFRRVGCTSIAGVPFLYQALERLRWERMDLPSLKTLTQAGGRLAPDKVVSLAQKAQQKGARLFVMYGQTEASPRMSYLPPERALEKPDSIGVAIPRGELFLRDGELIYRGPNVMMGYAHSWQDLSLGDVMQGELATGDLAEQDADGYFRITGRSKRMLKIQGLRLNLDEVEKALEAAWPHPLAVSGRDDLLVVFTEGEDATEPLAELVLEKFAISPVSVKVEVLDKIPLTSNGKPDYQELSRRS